MVRFKVNIKFKVQVFAIVKVPQYCFNCGKRMKDVEMWLPFTVWLKHALRIKRIEAVGLCKDCAKELMNVDEVL